MVHLPVAGVEVSGVLVILLGLGIGTLAGFLGVGGGFLLTPMLHALFHIPYTVAVGSSLSQMVGLSAAASITHGRARHIDYRLARILLIGSVIGVEAGAQVMEWLKGAGMVNILGGRMSVVSLVMSLIYATMLTSVGLSVGREAIRASRQRGAGASEPSTHLAGRLRQMRLRPMVSLPASGIPSVSVWLLVGAGLVAGFLSGLLGIGGGFILMPVLIYAIGCPTLVVVGTNLLQMVFTAGFATATHAMKGNVDLLLVLLMLSGSAAGAHIGATFSERFDARYVRSVFAVTAFVGVAAVIGKLAMTIAEGGG